ncbi:MAG: hypothetical protein Q4G26_09875 [Paracoccus sp. (in: a-proteobacteria)]|nr:hypothetical protein [Paracoccus sp. (in: a-proteobacteria)]
MKLRDDERPASFRLVPEWEGRKFWNAMARSIRVVSPTVLEVKSIVDSRVRVICFAFMMVWIAMPVIVSISDGDPPMELYRRPVDSFVMLVSPEIGLRATYERSMSWRIEADQVPYEEYLAEYVAWRPFGQRFRDFMFDMSLIWVALLVGYFALFFPAYAPIRIDREKRMIYTQRGRHLYIRGLPYDYDIHTDWRDGNINWESWNGWDLEATIPILSRVTRHSFEEVATIEMHRIDRPEKTRVFRLGAYPMTHRHTQGDDILNVIFAFSYLPQPGRTGQAGRPYDPAWQARLYQDKPLAFDWLRRLCGRTLGRRYRLDEAKVEAQLLEYATRPR